MTDSSTSDVRTRNLVRSILCLAACALGLPGDAVSVPQEGGAEEPAAPPARRAFTIEDLYRVASVPELAVAPDGASIVFVRRQRDLPRASQEDDLWKVGTEGGALRQLTAWEGSGESSIAWSPDGGNIAFVADRGHGEQIWLLPADGGEARAVATVNTGASDLVWSPDGRFIAMTSDVYPECGADAECNAERDRRRTEGPLSAHVSDELFYRHWTRWWDGKVPHVLVLELSSGRVRDMTPLRQVAPVFYLSSGATYDFTPDGGELVFQMGSAPREDAATSTNDDLYAVPVRMEGEIPEPVNLTAGNLAWDGPPRVSPDGRFIAFRRQSVPGYESDEQELAVLERETATLRVLTEGYDNWVGAFEWLPDSSGLVFAAEEAGRTPLYRIGLDGSDPVLVAADAQIDEFEVGPAGRFVFAARRAVGAPPEIWRYDLTGLTAARRLTELNRALEQEVDIRPAERMIVEGGGGDPIEVFVVKPHGFDPERRYPLILNVHGGPQSQWTDAFRGDWQVYPGAGYVVAFANPTGSTGYGQDFTAAISRNWGGRVFADLMNVADALAALPWVDEERMGAMGWSYGGYMMNWFLGHTDRFKAIASMMGLYDLPSFYGATEELWFPEWDLGGKPWNSGDYARWNPAAYASLFETPTLVVTGELDYRVPYTQSLQLFTALRRRGVPARLVVLPDAGHWPGWYEMALYYTAHLDWFHRWLGGDPAPWSVEDFAYNRVFDPETGERIDGGGEEAP
jgi:dipeptidyl aminopeptidase/acylaminoacyl peptidase